MGAVTDLWKSERGLVCVLLVIGATVLVGLGQLTAPEWIEFAKWIAVVYVGGKTLTSTVETVTRARAAVVDDVAHVDVAKPAPTPTP